MSQPSLQDRELWSTIENGLFGSIPEDQLIRQIYEAFTTETDRLKSADVIERNTSNVLQNGDKPNPRPSEILYGEPLDEVDRTYVGILALRWVLNGDYAKFTTGQSEQLKLTKSSFDWLQAFVKENVQTSMDVLSVILTLVVNDIGKDPELVNDYYEATGRLLSGSNHDLVLLEAAKANMIPSLNFLDDAHRNNILLGMELGSELNAGQLAQAENVPVNLEGLLVMEGNERAFNLKYIEQILDVAGAAGHVFAEGSKTFIEPVFQGFKTVQEVSLAIIRKECTLRQGYDLVLSKRAALLHDDGFRLLSVTDRQQRALLRLLTMGRAASLAEAQLFDAAFNDLDWFNKERLVDGLNIDAIEDNETAVLPYYMPAMIAETIQSTKDSGKEREALTSLMRYLSRALKWTDDENTALTPISETISKTWPLPKLHIPANASYTNKEGRVIERNMSRARDTISSPQFRMNPNVLDALEPPKGQVMARRRTSLSG